MTSLKQAGRSISVVIKDIADNVCADGSFCETVGWAFLSIWTFATMYLCLSQI